MTVTEVLPTTDRAKGGVPDDLGAALGLLGGVRERASAGAHRLSDAQLEGALCATESVRRAADAVELTLIAEVNRRGEERGPNGLFRDTRLGEGQVADMAPDTVGVAVGAGPSEAARRCDLAARATTDLADLAALIGEGRLRQRSLEIVERHTRDTRPETTRALVDYFLAPMRGRPGSVRIVEMEPREIAKACRRLIQRLEPDVMKARATKNRTTRLGVRTEPGPLGTTNLSAILPTEVGAALKSAIDEAGRLRLEDDPELPIGTARALGLTDLVLRGVEVRAEVRLGIPVIASAASRLTFAPVRGDECTGRCRDAPDELVTLGEGVTSQGRHDETYRIVTGEGADAVEVLSEEWLPGVTMQAPRPGSPHGTDGADWVSGTTIPGVGFVPPDVVAALTSRLDTKVSRALLDARTGTLLETSSPRYTIPDAQREFVTARDGTCRMWGCTRPVHTTRLGWKADVDHATPWPEGTTSPANLSALCRHHHRVKHSPRWRHVLHEDGTTEWLTPGGVPAFTFPAHLVHEDDGDDVADAGGSVADTGSSPSAGTNRRSLVGAAAGPPPF